MKTLYVWTREFPESQESIRKYAPGAEWFYTGKGQQSYPRKVGEEWGQDDLLIIEQDIIINSGVVSGLAFCDEPWCVYSYDIGSNHFPMRYGLGCTRFSYELQQEVPFERVLGHDMEDCKWCGTGQCKLCPCHSHQDTHIRHEIMKVYGQDVAPHVHGHLDHLHDFAGQEAMLSDAYGRYLWVDEHILRDPLRFSVCRNCGEQIFRLVIPGTDRSWIWYRLDYSDDCNGGSHYPSPQIVHPDDEIEDWDY